MSCKDNTIAVDNVCVPCSNNLTAVNNRCECLKRSSDDNRCLCITRDRNSKICTPCEDGFLFADNKNTECHPSCPENTIP